MREEQTLLLTLWAALTENWRDSKGYCILCGGDSYGVPAHHSGCAWVRLDAFARRPRGGPEKGAGA